MDARSHLSPQQFAGLAVSARDGLDGPLGSYGDPNGAAVWQNAGVAESRS